MKLQRYKQVRFVVILLVFVGVFVSVVLNTSFLAFISVGFGMVLMSFFKSQVKEIIEDERIKSIHGQAARASFVILLPILGLTSVMLLHVGNGPFYFLRSLGIILGYTAIVGLGIYLFSYWYFNRVDGE